jgi:hypothetical protein
MFRYLVHDPALNLTVFFLTDLSAFRQATRAPCVQQSLAGSKSRNVRRRLSTQAEK